MTYWLTFTSGKCQYNQFWKTCMDLMPLSKTVFKERTLLSSEEDKRAGASHRPQTTLWSLIVYPSVLFVLMLINWFFFSKWSSFNCWPHGCMARDSQLSQILLHMSTNISPAVLKPRRWFTIGREEWYMSYQPHKVHTCLTIIPNICKHKFLTIYSWSLWTKLR